MAAIDFQVEDGIGRLILDRPEKMNALNVDGCTQAKETLEDAEDDDDVHVIVLEGRGDTFCAGSDLDEMETALESLASYRDWAKTTISFLEKLEYFPKPVVASVEGIAFAGGFELTLLCDIVVAAEGTKFRLPEPRLGIVPGTASVKIQKVMPKHDALEIMMKACTFDAETAAEYGLVNTVVPPEDLDTEVGDLAAELKNVPQQSHALLKEIWHEDPDSFEFWYDELSEIINSETAAAGREAFKRGEDPPWVDEA
jgi:enoyl-CoA hydratase/carnithine racemase